MDFLLIASLSASGILLILVIVCIFQIRSLNKALEEKSDTLFAYYRNIEQKQENHQAQTEQEFKKLESQFQETQKLLMREIEALGHHITQNQVQQTHQIDQTIKKAISELEATITAPLL